MASSKEEENGTNSGRVCARWYNLSRSKILWDRVDAHDMQLTSHQVQKLAPILPACVKYLRICSLSTQQGIPFLTPTTAIEIRERCPLLNTLVIESAFVAKHINFTDITVEDLPQTLSVLSLRKSFFHTDQFFCSVSHPTVPKIKVLDCSSCWCVRDNDVLFFSRLSDLQEVYLAGCSVSDEGVVPLLKAVPQLKILDLEHTKITMETMLALSQHNQSLEKLYLGHNKLNDDHLFAIPSDALPVLKVLCLRKTYVSCSGLRFITAQLRALQFLNVSTCSITSECELELKMSLPAKKRLKLESDDESELADYCDHFLLRN